MSGEGGARPRYAFKQMPSLDQGTEPPLPAEDSPAPGVVERLKRLDLDALNRRYGPWLALASGILTLILWRRGASFAPAAVAGLVFAWTAAIALYRLLPVREEEPRWRRVLRTVAGTVVAGLYQDALFFLLPLWFGSATFTSANVVFPILLAAMAVFSCFEHLYTQHVLDHPLRRTVWTAIVLFATVTAAVPVLSTLSLRASLAAAAGLSALATALAVTPLPVVRSRRGLLQIAGITASAALVIALIGPLLPPVPVRTHDGKVGLMVENKELIGEASEFPSGIEKVYAWFAISAPPGYSQQVVFEWYRDGEPIGRPFTTTIRGGRKTGFRTWGYVSNPRAGSWRVDLYTDGGQLLARESFDVE